MAVLSELPAPAIFPSSGPSTGGTEVRLRFNSLPSCPILTPPPTVRFGDTVVEVSHYDGDGAQVRMSFLDPGSPGVIGEEIITLSYPTVDQPDDYPNRPSFAFINNLQEVVRRGVPGDVPLTSFHVRLTPVDPDVRIWAFASITNNETQLVTTITPQH